MKPSLSHGRTQKFTRVAVAAACLLMCLLSQPASALFIGKLPIWKQPIRGQRLTGVVAVPSSGRAQLVEDHTLGCLVGALVPRRDGLGHCPALTHRQSHLSGLPPARHLAR